MSVTIEEMDHKFRHYVNRYGFTTAGGDIDHIPLFHGFRILAEKHHNLLTPHRKNFHRKSLERLIHPKYPGILRPRPWPEKGGNHFSHDTHRAMMWIAGELYMPFAVDFIEHGTNWNPINPKKLHYKGTYWRFPSFMTQSYVEAQKAVHPVYRALTYYEVKCAANIGTHKRVEKITLPVFTYRSLEKLNDTHINQEIARWRKTKLEAYPGGLGERLDRWGGPWRNSPFAEYLWGVI